MAKFADDNRKKIEKICRTTFRGGRRAFAFAADTAALSAAVFGGLWLSVRPRFANRTAALFAVTAAFLTVAAAYCAVRRERYARHVKKLMSEAENDAAKAKLLLDPEAAYSGIEDSPGVRVYRGTDTLTADDARRLAEGCGNGLTIVTFAEPTDRAKELMAAMPAGVKAVTPLEYLGVEAKALCPVTRKEAEAALLQKHAGLLEKPDVRGLFALTRERAFKYFSVGAGLILLSFLAGSKLYFRSMAFVCFCIGAAALLRSSVKQNKKAG